MVDIKGSHRHIRLLVGVVILAVFCGGAVQAQDSENVDDDERWTDSEGNVWKNADGDCWETPNATREELREECGDVVEAEPEPGPMDSDGDGVVDARDQCPGTPQGTPVNRIGCPEQEAAPVVLRGVTFEFDSDKLTPMAEDRLDNVVNALQAAGDIDVRIEGHTDSIGPAEYNRQLSQERADSVKAYLAENGISSVRMQTKGFGESRPVAPNNDPDGSDNPEGRAKNRRVELHVEDQ